MFKQKNKYLLPIFALIFAQVFWGINTPVIKLGLETVPLPIYHSVTILGASLLLLPMAIKNWKPLALKYYFILIIGSILTISVGNILLLMGLQKTPSVNAPLIGLMQPILLVLLSVHILKEKFSLKTFAGIIISFTGALLILGEPWNWSGSSKDLLIGNVLLILSVLCSATSVLICKSVVKRANEYQVVFVELFVGILPTVIFALFTLTSMNLSSIDSIGVQAMAFNIFAVAAANYLFMYGLKRKKVQQVGMFSYIHPVVTAFSAWVILSEVPSSKIAIGGVLICIGIILSEARNINLNPKQKIPAKEYIKID